MGRFLKCQVLRIAASTVLGTLLPATLATAGPPQVGANVNMVSGTRFPEGDPFLTKQNEPSIAVSSRNPRHLLAASNDYRQVAVLTAEGLRGGKAWNTLYKSVDGGTSWRSVVLGGCPLDIAACNDSTTGLTAALKVLAPDFSADPTVRSGPHGTFFYSLIAGRHDGSTDGVVAVQRFVDTNNDIQRDTDVREQADGRKILFHAEDPILPDKMVLLDRGTTGQFIDKPWNAADIGGRAWNTGSCELLSWTKNRSDMRSAAETVPAFSVYVSYALFPGQAKANDHPDIYVAASNDCGNTFAKPVKLSNSLDATSGTSIAIDPLTGAAYVVWRRFGSRESPPKPDEIYLSKSSDGGRTWLNQPVRVAGLIPYDQGATGGSFRTLAFPSVAVSVGADGISRVHVAFTTRKAGVDPLPPYACQSANPKDCDTRVVLTTSTNGGSTWSAPAEVDPIPASPANPNGRGHQWQPALTFAAGKLAITWLDQRFDQTEEVLSCPAGTTCSQVSDLVRSRVGKGNLDPNCGIDVGNPELAALPQAAKDLLGPSPGACYEYRSGRPASVWTTYLSDGWLGLVRRHTVDVFAALADPANTPVFSSAPVSQYLFGSTTQDSRGNFEIRQKEVFAPNLPLFVNGTAAFIGDYIDIAGQIITATADPSQRYKFNIGATCTSSACSRNTTAGASPVFHAAFTDNRDVIPPLDGDWTRPVCLTTDFTGDPQNPTTNFGACAEPGRAGNRNQNVRSAIVAADSVAYAYTNSKLLSAVKPRGFVITVDNLGTELAGRSYRMSVVPPSGVSASFDKTSFEPPVGTTAPPQLLSVDVQVQPRSSATRSLWLKAGSSNARVVVQITSPPGCTGAGCYAAEVALNPDPGASQSLVGNGDGTDIDIANNDLGNVVLSNAVLTNNVLSNNPLPTDALGNAVLSNNALTNAALSNVVLSNAVLSNLQVENLNPATTTLDAAALSNAVLTNAALSNVVLSNAVLSNSVLSNNALSNAVLSNETPQALALSNAVLSNLALSNLALTNLDPANLALSNAVLSNNVLSNVALSNNALSNVVLTNAVLSNAALSNLALSNAALSNAALSNNALSNVVLSNKALSNSALDDDLKTIEPANPDLSRNAFTSADLANSQFADATFTVRNRGNTDTTLAVKLLLREPDLLTSNGIRLQLVMRKIVPIPTAIPPTGPATETGRALRIGLTQFNAQVSNVGTPEVVSPDAPDLGAFLPGKPDAATLPLAPGERAHVTLRAIGPGGLVDPVEFLRWGAKFVVVDAAQITRTAIPLIIKTLSVPATSALLPTTYTIRAAGGFRDVTGSVQCADSLGGPASDPCLPAASLSFPAGGGRDGSLNFTPSAKGSFYLLVKVSDQSVPPQEDQQLLKVVVDGAQQTVSPALTTLIPSGTIEFGRPVVLRQPTSTASGAPVVYSGSGACSVTGPDAAGNYVLTPTQVSPPDCVVTATVAGNTVYTTLTVVQSVAIGKGSQTIAFGPLSARTYGDAPFTLGAIATSGLPVAFSAATPAVCVVAGNTVTLLSAGTCTITASQAGDSNYNPAPLVQAGFPVGLASQTITFAALSARGLADSPFTVSATAGSGLAVAFSSLTTTVCTVAGNTVTLVASGTCTIAADQPGNTGFSPATRVTQSFTVRAAQTITFAAIAEHWLGDAPFAVTATASSGLPVALSVTTPAVCTISGNTVTLLAIGTCTIAADQAGNASFSAAAQVRQSVRVSGFVATGSLVQARRDHTATLLADGRVLVAGGLNNAGSPTDTSEIYTPSTGRFAAAGNLPSKSAGHTATLLDDGRVLAAGGGNSSTEIFNPATNTWSQAGGLGSTRSYHTATRLGNGWVLLAGGVDNAGKTIQSTILFNPSTGAFSNGPSMTAARERHSAILLASGKVLIAGGRQKAGSGQVSLKSAELCDAASCTAVAGTMSQARYGHSVVSSSVGVLVIGGADPASTIVELFNGTGFSTLTSTAMRAARRDMDVTVLADGRLLVTGGAGAAGTALQTSEMFDGAFFDGAKMVSPHANHRATRLTDGRVLLTGGIGSTGVATTSAELFVSGP